MNNTYFMYKENTGDRDEVKYIEGDVFGFECGHYFSSLNVVGACFSQSLDLNEINFEEITSVLSKDDFKKLEQYAKEINNLGYGIEKGSKRYKEGLEITKKANKIIDKLKSGENKELFSRVKKEEKNILMNNEGLTSDEVEQLFEEYPLEYKDKGILSTVFNDARELGEEEVFHFLNIPEQVERFFDYEKFGESLLDDEGYIELDTGAIAVIML